MRIGRGYVIALAVAILATVASVIAAGTNTGGSQPAGAKAAQAAQALALQHRPAAIASLQRVTVPADFRLLTTGCHWYRCYAAAQPTPQVAATIPAIMRSIGADNAESARLATALGTAAAASKSQAALERLGIHAHASRVPGCTTAYDTVHGLWAHCEEPAVIHDNVVAVFLTPYFDCPTAHARCHWTNETEVDITGPRGAPRILATHQPAR
jgi:hypothetical protein